MITVAKATSVEYYTSNAGVGAGMESYYTDAVTDGEPPGQWLGSGAEALGLAGEVDADDMHTLYGEFIHPHTGEPVGNRPARRRTADERYAAALSREPDASPERREELRRRADATGRANVIGWDLTFSAPKSVTVLHTAATRGEIAAGRTGDADAAATYRWVRLQIEDAITDANAAGLAEAERAATARTGGGAGGAMRWLGASRLIVASFRQHTNRSLEPHLHQHNVVLNRAICEDGKVRALDGRDLMAARFSFSAVSARTLTESLRARLGLDFRARPDGAGYEASLVPERVIEHFSARAQQTTKAMQPMVAEAEEAKGRPLSNREKAELHRRAQRSSRAAKTHDGESVLELDSRWDAELIAETGNTLTGLGDTLLHAVADFLPADLRRDPAEAGADHEARNLAAGDRDPSAARPAPSAPARARETAWSPEAAIEQAVASVSTRTPTWGRADLMWELHTHLPVTGIDPERVPQLLHTLADQALAGDGVVQVTGRDAGDFAAPTATRYAAAGTLLAEQALRGAAVIRGRHALAAAAVSTWLDTHTPDIGADQRAAVEGIASSDAALTVWHGPAGTGKSFAAGALAGAWEGVTEGEGRVFGLAISQVATTVLRDDGIARSRNVDRWLAAQERLETRAEPAAEDQEWRLGPRDLVMVDEASMVPTAKLEAIRARVEAVGARLVLTGDPRQLAAVEAGGVLGLLDGHAETYALSEVRRFAEPWERAASLALRDGEADALDDYDRHGRLVGYTDQDEAIAAAARSVVADRVDGRTSVAVTATNTQAAHLAAQVRDQLVDLGLVADGPGAILGRDRNIATVGDIVMCRRNEYGIGVTNRAQYRVLAVTPHPDPAPAGRGPGDGELPGGGATPAERAGWTLLVEQVPAPGRPAGQPVILPADYVEEDVQLAYASTVHAAQGITVDRAHLLTGTAGLNTAGAYVALTRGRERNTAHIPLTATAEEDSAPVAPTHRGGEVRFADHSTQPSARAVLQGILDAGDAAEQGLRVDETVAAHVAAERDATHAASMATITARLDAETRRVCRDRLERYLDDLVADGLLDETTRGRLAADQGSEHLARLLRAVEQGGTDPRQALTEAVTGGRNLADADSAAQVLSHRIGRHHAAALTEPPEAATVPADIPTRDADALARLHGRAADRARDLGTAAAEQAPDWAVLALGPVPPAEQADDLADWQQRAGTVAAHREAVGSHHPTRALDRMPGLAATERRATYVAAWHALGRPEPDLTEAAMTDGQLRTRIQAWRREQEWEPEYVDDRLRAAETTLQATRQAAALAAAEAEHADRSEDPERARHLHARADGHRQGLDLQAAVIDQLTEAAQVRATWYRATATTRAAHDRALAEATRRGLDLDQAHDLTTATDWLAAHDAAMRAEDPHRPITEADLVDRATAQDQPAAAGTPDAAGAAGATDSADAPAGAGPAPTDAADAVVEQADGAAEATQGADRTPSATSAAPGRFSPVELQATLATASLAAARLADRASQESAAEAAHAEHHAIEAAEAGRRRRELADLDLRDAAAAAEDTAGSVADA